MDPVCHAPRGMGPPEISWGVERVLPTQVRAGFPPVTGTASPRLSGLIRVNGDLTGRGRARLVECGRRAKSWPGAFDTISQPSPTSSQGWPCITTPHLQLCADPDVQGVCPMRASPPPDLRNWDTRDSTCAAKVNVHLGVRPVMGRCEAHAWGSALTWDRSPRPSRTGRLRSARRVLRRRVGNGGRRRGLSVRVGP